MCRRTNPHRARSSTAVHRFVYRPQTPGNADSLVRIAINREIHNLETLRGHVSPCMRKLHRCYPIRESPSRGIFLHKVRARTWRECSREIDSHAALEPTVPVLAYLNAALPRTCVTHFGVILW
jgi:hypothetical protein